MSAQQWQIPRHDDNPHHGRWCSVGVSWRTGISPPVRGSAAWARTPHSDNSVVMLYWCAAKRSRARTCTSRRVYVYGIVFGRPGCPSIYTTAIVRRPLPPPTQILAPFWLKYLMFASPTLLEPEAILSGVVGGVLDAEGLGRDDPKDPPANGGGHPPM